MGKLLRKAAVAALLMVASIPVQATVTWGSGQALAPDPSRVSVRLGKSTLTPIRLERSAFTGSRNRGFLVLPSNSGVATYARFHRLRQRLDGRIVWIGKVRTDFGSESAIVVFNDRTASGIIPQRRGPALRVVTLPSGLWLADGDPDPRKGDVWTSDIAPATAQVPPKRPWKRGAAAKGVRASQLPPVIDVTVLYSAEALLAAGSKEALETGALLGEAYTNQAFADSMANVQVRVVGFHLFDVPGEWTHDQALGAITGPSFATSRDLAARFRAADGSDLVGLIRPSLPTFTNGGISTTNGFHESAFQFDNAFFVAGCDDAGAVIPSTFAHEIGHNLGLAHDFETAGGDYGHFVYSRGHRLALTPTTGFATIMAYGISGVTHPVSRFSNPNQIDCMGQACGVPNVADNVRSLNETASITAGFLTPEPQSPPRLLIESAAIRETDAGTSPLSFTARLTRASLVPVTFSATAVSGSAESGSDFLSTRFDELVIPAGQLTTSFNVPVVGDAVPESRETFRVHVSNAVGATIYVSQAVGIILDNDLDSDPIPLQPGLWFGPLTYLVDEPTDYLFTFNVPPGATSVSFETQRGNGDADLYVQRSSPPLLVGFDCMDCKCTSLGPTTAEMCSVSQPEPGTYYALVRSYYVDGLRVRARYGTNPTPQMTVSDLWQDEGTPGTKPAFFYLSILPAATSAVTFSIATSPGTAQPGVDYTEKAASNQSMAAGTTTRAFFVNITGDAKAETNETFTVNLDQVIGSIVAKAQGKGVILDDDSVALTIRDAVVLEGSGGAGTTVAFDVMLSRPSAMPVSFDIETLPGTAIAGVDYMSRHQQTRVIDPGRTRSRFEVTVVADSAPEGTENFRVMIRNAVGAVITDEIATGTIQDDD